MLEPAQVQKFSITKDIPLNCKIQLTNQQSPLAIRIAKSQEGDLTVYTSFKNQDPTEEDCTHKFTNQTSFQIREPAVQQLVKRRFGIQNSTVNFKSNFVFLSFITSVSMQISVCCRFVNRPKAMKSPKEEEEPTVQMPHEHKLIKEIKDYVAQPYIANEKICRMNQITKMRRRNAKEHMTHDAVTTNKQLL